MTEQQAGSQLSSPESLSLFQMSGTSLVAQRQTGEGHWLS